MKFLLLLVTLFGPMGVVLLVHVAWDPVSNWVARWRP